MFARVGEDISRGEDRVADVGLSKVLRSIVHRDRTDPEMIVVAEGLIPGDRLIKPCRLVRFLIIDGVGSEMSTGTWGDDLAVKDIDIPPQFVVLSAVAGIAQRDAEIKRIFFVKGVYRLDGCVENMSCIQHDPLNIAKCTNRQCWMQSLKIDQLS